VPLEPWTINLFIDEEEKIVSISLELSLYAINIVVKSEKLAALKD
jgi:hypothetical protein